MLLTGHHCFEGGKVLEAQRPIVCLGSGGGELWWFGGGWFEGRGVVVCGVLKRGGGLWWFVVF